MADRICKTFNLNVAASGFEQWTRRYNVAHWVTTVLHPMNTYYDMNINSSHARNQDVSLDQNAVRFYRITLDPRRLDVNYRDYVQV